MTRRLDTMAGRTVFVLLFAVGVLHVMGLLFYDLTLRSELATNNETRLTERLLAVRRELARLPAAEREPAAHAMSGGPFEVHWSRSSLAAPSAASDNTAATLKRRLQDADAALNAAGLLVGASSLPAEHPGEEHVLMVSMGLGDASWANVAIVSLSGVQRTSSGYITSMTTVAAGVLLVSIVLASWLTSPLRRLAEAARGFKADARAPFLAEHGPREVREAAKALNEMGERVRRMISDRTMTLAAISHDLKTPLTRLRLRLEDLNDAEVRTRAHADIREMEHMIGDTIAFLRDETSAEPARLLDLRALLATLCDEQEDLGAQASLGLCAPIIVKGRHLDLKRAFTNLVQNAIKYGGSARVSATVASDHVKVAIDDDGPGVPADQLAAVFEPFVRIEASRNRETGGVGLGLTIARRIIRAHEEEVTLVNLKPKGLRAIARLPIAKARYSQQFVTPRKYARNM